MNPLAIVISCLLASSAFSKNANKSRVKQACKKGDFAAISAMQCSDIKRGWFSGCLKNKVFEKDAALAEMVKKCPTLLPQKDKKFEKAVRHLYQYSQFQTLRVALADGRCKKISVGLRNFFMKSPDLNVAQICQQDAPSLIPDANSPAATAPLAPTPAGNGTAPAVPAVEGSLKDYTKEMVEGNKGLLAGVNAKQASELGQCNDACLGLTAEHFSTAGVKPEVVAALSIRCMRDARPEAFAGLTKDQVKAMIVWPFIRRKQLKAIKPEAIVTLPFDQLGIGKQTKKNANSHACIAITKDQLKAIRKNKKANSLYKSRCIKNSAPSVAPPSNVMLFLGGLACAIFFLN